MSELSDDELLEQLGVESLPVKASAYTAQQERVIAGFEEILRFTEKHGRVPAHGEDRDIFERLYAVRLDRLRTLTEFHPLLMPMDPKGLLSDAPAVAPTQEVEKLPDDELLAALGVGQGDDGDITRLTHVRSYEERQAAEEIANRTKCPDFDKFAPLFERVEAELKSGIRRTIPFSRDASIAQGNFFILGGQLVYVAEMGEQFRTSNGDMDARLRAVYSNATESNLLLRSLQRALYKDDTARRLTDPSLGPLFGDVMEPDDIEDGTIYVLRSLSDDPYVVEHRQLIHKIGVTGGDVAKRISAAPQDATYLLAKVEVVATYKLANLNRTKMENLFHRIFQPARLSVSIKDRFGNPVQPREWFLVPLDAIDEAVKRILDGSITGYVYDPSKARLVKRGA